MPIASVPPRLGRIHQAGKSLAARWPIEDIQIMLIAFGIDLDEGLVEQRVFGCAVSGLDHEVGAGLSAYLRGTIDQDADIFTDAQIDGLGAAVLVFRGHGNESFYDQYCTFAYTMCI
ncbi:hypothetical protein MPLB_1730013 [Mesorhizobium sp. ORS 3324]|nr:hypothetical protein MPLB_1730013 [Mesorhizobium sp. ORS 3324]